MARKQKSSLSLHSGAIVEFEVRDGGISRSSFIVQDFFFAILDFLFFHMKLSIVLSRSVKNFAGVLMDIALDLYIAFGKIACHFYYVNSTYPRAWEIFPFSDFLFDFFLQRFKVLF